MEESEYIRDFTKLAPPTFGGKGTDLEVTKGWLECIEIKFTFFNCRESHKMFVCHTYVGGTSPFLVKIKEAKGEGQWSPNFVGGL